MADYRYRCGRKEVLPEDEYDSQLETIIHRDFYPDLVRVGRDEVKTLSSEKVKDEIERDADGFPCLKRPRVTLDGFQAMNTTEDDEAFQKLIDLEQVRRQKKLKWMLTDSAKHNEDLQRKRETLLAIQNEETDLDGLLIGGSAERRQKESGRDLILNRHVAQSAMVFAPDVKSDNFGRPVLPVCANSSTLDNSLALRSSEAGVLAHACPEARVSIKPKVIHTRTRFSVEDQAAVERLALVAPEQSRLVGEEIRKAQEFDECLVKGRFSGTNDPRIVATPIIAPESIKDGPIMTWGSIVSTPVEVANEEIPSTTFSLPAPRKEEAVARNISTAKRMRERQKKSYAQALRDELAALAGGRSSLAVGRRTPQSSLSRNSIFSGLTPNRVAGSTLLNTPLAKGMMKKTRESM